MTPELATSLRYTRARWLKIGCRPACLHAPKTPVTALCALHRHIGLMCPDCAAEHLAHDPTIHHRCLSCGTGKDVAHNLEPVDIAGDITVGADRVPYVGAVVVIGIGACANCTRAATG